MSIQLDKGKKNYVKFTIERKGYIALLKNNISLIHNSNTSRQYSRQHSHKESTRYFCRVPNTLSF